jgi:hypothetical protein
MLIMNPTLNNIFYFWLVEYEDVESMGLILSFLSERERERVCEFVYVYFYLCDCGYHR